VLTRETARIMNTEEEKVRTLIYEVPKENWGKAGALGLESEFPINRSLEMRNIIYAVENLTPLYKEYYHVTFFISSTIYNIRIWISRYKPE
jgi:hypothetical protein